MSLLTINPIVKLRIPLRLLKKLNKLNLKYVKTLTNILKSNNYKLAVS